MDSRRMGSGRSRRRWRLWVGSAVAALLSALTVAGMWIVPAGAELLPDGFGQTLITGTGSNPTSLRVAPDGRVFVLEHVDTGPTTGIGNVRVIENDVALATPMLSIPVERGGGQEGLQDLAFHPNFPTTPYIYVSYTVSDPTPRNRVSRWLVTGNVATGLEEVVFELPAYPGTTDTHFGGSIVFGSDGKLYWSVGDHQDSTLVQRFDTLFGKVLRLNPDGSIPSDNPFYGDLTGDFRAIYALGLRNPWKMAHDPVTGAIHIQDVGAGTWEEVNVLTAGANYGWPVVEGPGGGGTYVDPLRAFNHESGTPFACAVVGGDFYRPVTATFPADYIGDYFVGEFCNSWIYRIDLATGDLIEFSDETEALPAERCSACGQLLDVKVAPDGSLWQLRRISVNNDTQTRLFKTEFIGNSSPIIGVQPLDASTVGGSDVTFSVVAFGQAPLSYQWQKDGVDIPGATDTELTLVNVQPADDGSTYRVVVTNGLGNVTSDDATLTVLPGAAPTGSIDTPVIGTTYAGGMTIAFSGSGTDQEDGVLPASAFEWSVDFYHDDHTHPFITTLPDVKSGSFVVPDIGETETTVFFRINLKLTDSDGAQAFYSRDVLPQLVDITVETEPSGLLIALDGQPAAAPYTFESVVGVNRILTAPLLQTVGNDTYVFAGWSNNKGASQSLPTPSSNTTFTATYRLAVDPPSAPFMAGHITLDGDTGESVTAPLPGGPSPDVIELFVNAALDDWSPSSVETLVGSNKSTVQLLVLKNGRLKFVAKLQGAKVNVKSPKLGLGDGERVWVRVRYDSTTGDVEFFTSLSTEADPADVTDWVSAGSVSSNSGTIKTLDELVIGRQKPGGKKPASGLVYGAVAEFDGVEVSSVDFTDTDDLTSTPPDFTEWGDWTLVNAPYTEGGGMAGPGYVWFAGLSGDSARASVNGLPSATVVDARVNVSMNDWTPLDIQALLGANSSNVKLELMTNGQLRLTADTANNRARATSTTTPVVPADGRLWVRARYDATTGIITFFTSTDTTSDGANVTGWTQLGDPVDTGITGQLDPNTETIILGGGSLNSGSGGYHPMVGKMHGAALFQDTTLLTAIDFTDTDDLTTIPPDYSGWGDWVVQGQLWEYIPASG